MARRSRASRSPPPRRSSTASRPSALGSRASPAADGRRRDLAALADAAGRGLPIVAYNAAYDLTLLEREAARYGIAPLPGPGPVIDPLVIDKAVDRYRRGKRTLTAAAEHYGVALPNAHDAGADAVAAGRVAQAIARAYPELAASRSPSCTRGRSTGAASRPRATRRSAAPTASPSSPPRAPGPCADRQTRGDDEGRATAGRPPFVSAGLTCRSS